MDVISTIERRREITQFTPEPIPQETMDALIRSLYLAPSGNNLPSREFILVTDKKMLSALTATTPYMKWLEQSAAGIVLIGSPEVSKYWLQDASIAGGYLWLTAVSLGLGFAWGAVYHAEDALESKRREDTVRNLLQIPDSYRVIAILGMGYAALKPSAKEMYPLERVFHKGRFGS